VIGKSLELYGEWAQIEIDLLIKLIQPSEIIVDGGAFIGTHSLPLVNRLERVDPRYNLEADIDLEKEPFDSIIWGHELGINDFTAWVFTHTVVEISTAVKGPAFQMFAKEKLGKVIYLDPDIAVFNSMEWLETLLDDHDILLAPHLVQYQTDARSIWDNEINSALRHGVFGSEHQQANRSRFLQVVGGPFDRILL